MISSDNNTSVICTEEVSCNIGFNEFKKSVNVEDIFIYMFGDSANVVLTHRYDDLFLRGSFGSHVDPRPQFTFGIMGYVVYFNDFFL